MVSTPARTVGFVVRAPLRRADLPGLCDRACVLLAGNGGATVDCDVAGVAADAVSVEALARLYATARRRGCTVRLRGASAELLELVDLMGLGDVLG